MSREKQLIKNTAIITVGKVCTQMISFFLLPLYTAIFSTEEFGIVDLFNTIVAFLIPILTLQIEQGIFRFLIDAREDSNTKKQLISSTIILFIIQAIIYSAIFMLLQRYIHNEYKYFLLLNVIANMFSGLMLQISRGVGKNTHYSIGSFIVAGFTVILNVLFIVILRLGVSGMFLAIFIANSIATIYLIIALKIHRSFSIKVFDKKILKSLLKYSLPLIPNAISWWIVNVSDRAIISGVLNVAANGIYAAANKFSGVFINVYNIFNIAWTESAAMHIEDKDKDEFFSKTINTGFKVFASIALMIIAVSPFVFPLLINSKFIDAYNQIPILMISSVFNVGVGLVSVIYVAKKRSKDIAKTSFFAAIINILINILLIKKIGLYAASISTVCAYFAMFIYRTIDCKKYVNFKLDIKMITILSITYALTCVMYYINTFAINIAMLAFVTLFVVIFNKGSFKVILKIMKRKLKRGEG